MLGLPTDVTISIISYPSGELHTACAGNYFKNYLFCGNHDAAENAAIMYSLFGCCKAADVNPREWLTDILGRIPEYNKDYSRDLAELLPHNWKAAKKIQDVPKELE